MSAQGSLTKSAAIGLVAAVQAYASVSIHLGQAKVSKTRDGTRIEQSVALANAIADYELTYTAEHSEDGTRVLRDSWGWGQGYVALGMTAPSKPNWYYQAFFNWHFDDDSIHVRPAAVRVVREAGDSGMIEYTWETSNASVSIRFAMVAGSDKLLMFGEYEPKTPIERTWLRFVCYPAFFPEPRERAVTTSAGTRRPGEHIAIDLAKERWILYEDTSEGREGQGSAGMIIGTPNAFDAVSIPVSAYGIVTTLELTPDTRRFALALYDFPSMPACRQTREYFARLADREAEALTKLAAGNLDAPLDPLPVDEQRVTRIMAAGRKAFDRPEELWRPDPAPLEFPWAARVPGEPINTAVFCRRWQAWELMELARRLEMSVEHLYWDAADQISNPRSWPYAAATGVGPIPYGTAARRATELASDEAKELFIVGGLSSVGVPGVTRTAIAKQVAAGKGLLLVGPRGRQNVWPSELFAVEAPELVAQITAGFDPEAIAGLAPEQPGRVRDEPIVSAWTHGAGRVILFNVNLGHFSSLMPNHTRSEGILEAMDRWLGLCARAAAVAAGRKMPATVTFGTPTARSLPLVVDGIPTNGSLRVRIQDDLGRVIATNELPLPPIGGAISLPIRPPSRTCTADILVVDAAGNTLGMASLPLPRADGPRIASLDVGPASQTHELAPPRVDLPEGGRIECKATIDAPQPLDGAELRWQVRDAFDRVLAAGAGPVPAAGGEVSAAFVVPRPVTVCHVLALTLARGTETLDYEQRRFTMTVPYPYEDFTALMWNTASTSPLLLHTDRFCYQWGADMCDPANTLRADDQRAALMYDLRSRSGMRLVPYVTRIHAQDPVDNVRKPSLSDPQYLEQWTEWLTIQGRQAAAYQPAAYTLGDENFLYRGQGEVDHHPAAKAEFRAWLERKYGTIAELNRVWRSEHASFQAIEPMLLEEVVERPGGFAPWIDHKVFLDDSFANTHNDFRRVLREQDPGAKVGWDGFLAYGWKSGYDFVKLTAECELNQIYIGQWLQGRLVTDFKRADALTGMWGNRVADNEAGWMAFPWACLLQGHNSAWWWTSWGCDYVPFYPDLSQSNYGKWFFKAVRQTTSGPGRLIVQAEREASPIAVLYSKRNMFAATIAGTIVQNQPWAGDTGFRTEHESLLKALFDLGYDPTHISEPQLAAGIHPHDYRVVVLPLATCLSDQEVASLSAYVEAGGILIVNGRAGILTGEGALRDTRPLDDVLGVAAAARREAFVASGKGGQMSVTGPLPSPSGDRALNLEPFAVHVIEPNMQTTTGQALAEADGAPVLVANRFGKGMAYTLNIAMLGYNSERVEPGQKPRQEILDAMIRGADIAPPAEIVLAAGGRALMTHQFGFRHGSIRYLGIQQDILMPRFADQTARIRLPEPAIVYDVRAGERVGRGHVREWEVTLSRGYPLLYALMPYEVIGMGIEAANSAARGTNFPVSAKVRTSAGTPAHHVVRLDVYAPGSDEPHRQYSQNVDCPGGTGNATIPFALSDMAGTWRIEARDAASGVKTEIAIQVR